MIHACPVPQSAVLVHVLPEPQFPHESHTAVPSIALWHAEYEVALLLLQPMYVDATAYEL